uniref:Arm DNA-binding domain-containing protein n=1 Tax=Parabacteroides distasonis TaxID=823 RepID=UPI0040258935
MEYPTLRFVFDRKRVATKEKKGLVQIEVCSERKRKWIGTGVRLYSDQWDERKKVVRTVQSVQLNLKLDTLMSNLLEYVNSLIRRKVPFDFEALDLYLTNASTSDSFVDFLIKKSGLGAKKSKV